MHMSPLRILIADDQEKEIVTARDALQAAQHQVDTATSFSEACRLAATNRYDIAIIDRGWYTDKTLAEDEPKGYKGWEIADAVRAQSPRAFMILYTTHADEPSTIKTAEQKGMILVKKRFNPEARENLAQTAIALVVEAYQRTMTIGEDEKKGSDAVPASAPSDRGPRVNLRKILDTRLNESELRALCFDLNVDYENLKGEVKRDKAIALIVHLEQRGRLRELRTTGKELRPDIDWDG
jgi:CheY-like chemotaxis protein